MIEAAACSCFTLRRARWATHLWWLAALSIWLGCMDVARAIKPDRQVSEFDHMVWTQKDGVPLKLFAIAQTEDGWLWFGGPTGLYQFDGVQMQEVRRHETDGKTRLSVSVLYAPANGGLVIGAVGGGISIYHQGKFTNYDDEQTVRAGRVQNFARDVDGTLWAACEHALLRFDGRRWVVVGEDWGYPGVGAAGISVDSSGTLWVATATRVLYLPRRSRTFRATDIRLDVSAFFVQSPDGLTWLLRRGSAVLLPEQAPARRDPLETSRMSSNELFDTEGYFWSYDPKPSGLAFPAIQGLSALGKRLTTVLEDRQGNIWYASIDGEIHRFRRPSLTKVAAPGLAMYAPPAAMAPDTAGRMWFALTVPRTGVGLTGSEGAWMFDTSLRRIQLESLKGGEIARDPRDGSVWYAAEQTVWRLTGERFEPAFPLPEDWGSEPAGALSPGCAGGLWISNTRMGLWRHDGTAWRRKGNIESLPDEAPTRQLCDTSERLWLGYQDGTLIRVDGSHVTRVGAADALQVGPIIDISVGQHLFVAGERGLALLIDNRFFTLNAALPSAFEGITGISETSSGDVWLNGAAMAARIRARELPRSAEAAVHPLPVQAFDVSDGYPGPGYTRPNHSPNTAVDSKGRVWVSGLRGIAYVDDAVAPKPAAAPAALIRSVRAGTELHEAVAVLGLPEGTRDLRFDYTALSYSHPERLRFRHRLEGIDEGWVDDEGRRQASYANMGPGTYRFIVNASDETGAWGTALTSMTVTIAPTFVQSRFFIALCGLVTLGLALFAHRLRLGQVAARQKRLLEARLYERERIARELHDTLLQGTQAFILKIHALANELPPGGSIRARLSDALKAAQDAVNEGRDRIQALRDKPVAPEDLETALAAFGTHLVHGTEVQFRAVVDGSTRELRPPVADAADLVGREALRNALRHATPTLVELQIIYSEEAFRLRVRDDGSGIDESMLKEGARQGHWGLTGMRERAGEVGAELVVWTRAGAGTEVELRVPAGMAYKQKAVAVGWGRRLVTRLVHLRGR